MVAVREGGMRGGPTLDPHPAASQSNAIIPESVVQASKADKCNLHMPEWYNQARQVPKTRLTSLPWEWVG